LKQTAGGKVRKTALSPVNMGVGQIYFIQRTYPQNVTRDDTLNR